AAALVAQPAGQPNLADLATMDEVHGLAHPRAAAALRSGLANLAGGAGGFDDAPALAHVVADGLLDVHVLARLHCPDGRQRVPVVWRGNRYDVDRLVLEDLADVRLVARQEALLGKAVTHCRTDNTGVGIADGGNDAVALTGKGVDVAHAAAIGTIYAHDGD